MVDITEEFIEVQEEAQGKKGKKIHSEVSDAAKEKKAEERQAKGDKKGVKPVEWRPSSLMPPLVAPKGYTPRWVENTVTNVQKKQAEGWVLMNGVTCNVKGSYQAIDVKDQGGSISGAPEYREMIGMMLPKEKKEGRDKYHADLVEQHTRATLLKAETKGGKVVIN